MSKRKTKDGQRYRTKGTKKMKGEGKDDTYMERGR